MTRIIGGSAKGRRLKTPTGDRTRPTSDRVREALFSALESELGSLVGLRVLDLYAGSGAVGLEALSRGAAAATLVESDRRTVATVVRPNADTLGLPGADVLAAPVERALAGRPSAPYDVVFADPPYLFADDDLATVLGLLVAHDWLTGTSVVVVERSKRSGEPPWPEGITGTKSKKYGETTLWWAAKGP
ncbi:MAG: putative methyltransferase [Nocardioidaceae bacterium]|nr:putative methyltransferase [Nocardioidaceae bacterium]